MTNRLVPRRAEALLESLAAPSEFRDDVLGDLAEEYAIRVRWDGPAAARRWYYRESVRLVPYLLRDARRSIRTPHVVRALWMLAWSTLAAFAFDSAMTATTHRVVFMITGIPLNAYLHHWDMLGTPATQMLMLAFTAVTGTVGGIVASSFGGRARLANALVAGTAWAGLMLTGLGRAPLGFIALNILTVLAATTTVGVVRVLRRPALT